MYNSTYAFFLIQTRNKSTASKINDLTSRVMQVDKKYVYNLIVKTSLLLRYCRFEKFYICDIIF